MIHVCDRKQWSLIMILISQDVQALPESCDTSNYQAVACQGASLVETANLHFPCEGDSERFCAKHICKRRIWENKWEDGEMRLRLCWIQCSHSQSLARAMRDVLTASESSMGNSGGTTDVRIRVHSRNSLYLFLFGSFVPERHGERSMRQLIHNIQCSSRTKDKTVKTDVICCWYVSNCTPCMRK